MLSYDDCNLNVFFKIFRAFCPNTFNKNYTILNVKA